MGSNRSNIKPGSSPKPRAALSFQVTFLLRHCSSCMYSITICIVVNWFYIEKSVSFIRPLMALYYLTRKVKRWFSICSCLRWEHLTMIHENGTQGCSHLISSHLRAMQLGNFLYLIITLYNSECLLTCLSCCCCVCSLPAGSINFPRFDGPSSLSSRGFVLSMIFGCLFW